jgi:hypothetical protein
MHFAVQVESTMRRKQWPWIALLLGGLLPVRADDAPRETVRYVRPAAQGFVPECRFLITRHEGGWTITSQTERGDVRMEVETRYDAEDRPTAARAVLTSHGRIHTVTVQVRDGKATVQREGGEPAEFEIPRGTIITSAPDWSDVFLLCRRSSTCVGTRRQRRGRQEFPALWIHPTQPAQRLTFSIEWQGTDRIERDGEPTELGRYLIRIRNNSRYAAWADAQGRMVRLIPLPLNEAAPGLTLEGYEKAAASLRPPALPPSGGGRALPGRCRSRGSERGS